jgi:hypothetical protein
MRRFAAYAALAITWGLLFLAPSAYAIHRGLPRWAAATIGGIAFLLPLVWHLVGERRRRKAATKSSLTGGDRLTLRLIAAALVTIGPLVALDGGGLWTAGRERATWWLDWRDPPGLFMPVRDARLLDAIPEDAEALAWDLGADFFRGGIATNGADGKESVLALAPGRLVVAMRGTPAQLDRLRFDDLATLARLAGIVTSDSLAKRRPAPDLLVVVSDEWAARVDERLAGRGRRPDKLLARLRVPADALAAAVWHPSSGSAPLTEAQGWLRRDGGGEHLDADLHTTSAAAAETMRVAIRGMVGNLGSTPLGSTPFGECAEQARTAVDGVTVSGKGADVHVRALFHQDRLDAAVACVLRALPH